ncbi:MAG: RdgB/HAM1 family non-canonical purine NTP pyrophosphatase [Aquificaceae bacterium]|nr:RdgB/HAM1 family non-canonical purine NTP pyrophosphatase [Aquificaceae bacterium]MCX8060112.1 RdgB/HAM1 family non-canonical purine NTP pyrophosphatase [Aquificaceae bacterium]MDW8096962.1 RdgB/HAM1 family non-canonical purine NTP pyrophosphatase [Aquificaceae bacterium]
MRLLVATSNRSKRAELERLFQGSGIELLVPPRELSVEESGESFFQNAYLKARAYYETFGVPALAEDSGLVVPALGGYPGIYSSRFYQLEWGGVEKVETSEKEANIKKLLRLMEGVHDRRAYFHSCVVLYMGNAGLWAEGRCDGEVLAEARGEGGFGYDPVFRPEGHQRSMAELSPEEKDRISHRGKAVRRLLKVLCGKSLEI